MLRFRSHLVRLVLVTVLPLAVLATGLAAWIAHERREDQLRAMDATAAALQMAVDRELRVTMAMLDVLGASPLVDEALGPEPPASAAIAALHRQAVEIVARRPTALANILLHRGIPSRILMNTLVPPGTPLPEVRALRYPAARPGPPPDDAAIWADIAATGRARISDLIEGVVARRWLVAIATPVMRNGRMIGGLTATILPASIGEILREHPLRPGWSVAVVDRAGVVVARSSDDETQTAVPAIAEVRRFQQDPAARAARIEAAGPDGTPSYGALRRLATVPWSVAYVGPRSDVDSPFHEALAIAGAGGALAVLLGAAAALWLGARLGTEIEALAGDATAMGAGEPALPGQPRGNVAEVALVQQALHASAAALRTRTEAKQAAEQRQILLLREVDHRARNALTVALAAVRMTPRTTSPREFAATVEGRIAALAKAHSLLAATAWTGAGLDAVARGEVGPFGARVRLAGPAIRLAADAVQPCAMILHELATNAAKHGALSVPDGHVELRWEPADTGTLHLAWQESGGPAQPGPPPGTGFGTRLMHQLATHQLGGTLTMHWQPDGLRVEMTLPPEVVERASETAAG